MSALQTPDRVNDDLSRPARSHARDAAWTPSPMGGVHRRMLDRIGGEVARATSVVRYDSGSHFSPHRHDGGEEFLVLSGTFQDEHGDYPTGTYVRNPVGTAHTPFTEPGCIIFVKLWQFDANDSEQFFVDTSTAHPKRDPTYDALSLIQLFRDGHEDVRIELLEAGQSISREFDGGMELYVLAGMLAIDDVAYEGNDWLRLPAGSETIFEAGPDGARYWIKTGHLADPRMGPTA